MLFPKTGLALLAGACLLRAQVQVGSGSYANSGTFAVPPGNPYVTPDFSQPVASATWWSSLITMPLSRPLFPYPFTARAVAQGLELGAHASPQGAATNYALPHRADLTVGVQGLNAPEARVASYSHWSVTARWSQSPRVLEATIGHGFPFVYFKVTGGMASVALGSGGAVTRREDEALAVSVGGRHYALFAPTGSAWSGTAPLTSSLAGKDYLSVAALPDTTAATFAFFRRYAYSFITRTQVSWQYQEPTAHLISTFSAVTEAKEGSESGTLFALFRHQWLEVAGPLTLYTYPSARGLMKVVAGNSFATSMVFNGILPAMPHLGSDPSILRQALSAVAGTAGGADSYNSGKSLGRLAALVPIAQLAGESAKRTEFVNGIKAALQDWLTAGGSKQLYYHRPWNTLIGYPASFGSETRLSDHHFHYGYFLMGAAAVAQADPAWAAPTQWGGMAEMLIREIVNWRDDDALFGRFRYFDPYEGHGWADGMGFDRGNNQESSSESMNANAAIILWGIHTGNKALRDLGIFMYVHEARAIEQYWWDVDGQVFPSGYGRDAVGILWSDGGAFATWFSSEAEKIIGINIFPATAGHLYYGRRPDYVLKNFAAGYRQGSGSWSALFNKYLAFADADQAVANYGSGQGLESGETHAHTYHFLRSLQAVGRLSTEVVGSIPSFAVFDKGSTRAYTAYNPDATPRMVSFNDGFSMEVPAKTQLTRTGPVRPLLSIRQPPRRAAGHYRVLEVGADGRLRFGAGLTPDGRGFDLRGRR